MVIVSVKNRTRIGDGATRYETAGVDALAGIDRTEIA